MRGMAQSRKGSTYSKNSVLEIFGLLWEETDDHHGLSIPQIRERLIERHERIGDVDYQAPSERTIREQLYWLARPENTILERPIRRIDAQECEDEGITDYTPGWYMSEYLTTPEMRLLADSLMLSRINEDMLEELSNKIMRLSGGKHALLQQIDHITAFDHYNNEFLSTIEKLDRAVDQQHRVEFEYCDYNRDGKLIPCQYKDGSVKRYILDPYRLVYKTGKYYILGHLIGTANLIAFVADRIHHLEILEREELEIPLEAWREDGTLRPRSDSLPEGHEQMTSLKRNHRSGISNHDHVLDPVKFIRERPYMVTTASEPITMVIKENMLTNLYEWFNDPVILDEQCGNYIVQVMSPEMAMLWWTLQYAESKSVYIIEPQSLRRKLYRTGEFLMSSYRALPF